MKHLFTAMLLLLANAATAQIVNIPDANFKAALTGMGVDTNNDGEIQQSEALAVTEISITVPAYYFISDLTGIRSFTNLQKLTCRSLQLSVLDVSGLSNLRKIDCSYNQLTVLNTAGCSNLQSLSCQNNNLKDVDFSGYPNLDSINLDRNDSIDIFNAANCPRLKWVDLSCARSAGYYGSTANMVNLVNCDSLTFLNLFDRYIDILDISGSDKITSVGISGIVKTLIAKNCTSLTTIATGGNLISSISGYVDVTGCINLTSLHTGEAGYLTNIDLSTCPNLRSLSTVSLRSLYVNIKNGSRQDTCGVMVVDEIPNDNIPTILTICADDFEVDSISAHIVQVAPFTVNSYCSFTPAGTYNTINGNIKLDINNNGCDDMDRGMPSIPIKVTSTSGNSFLKYTKQNGGYEHYFYTGNFSLSPYFAYPYFAVTPATATVYFDTANSLTDTKDFCIAPLGTYNDLEITFLPVGNARPGFDAAYDLIYKNRGTTTLSGNVSVNFDNNKMNFVSASSTIASQSSGQVVWSYNNLQPFESRTIHVTFTLLPPPVNNISDTITYLAAITPSNNDETTFDNSFILPQRIRGAMDPNEKQCLEGSKLDIGKIGEYLHYQIHFQNEGTDTAFNIVVADTLSEKLDWNSLELISSSHPCSVNIKNNKVEFIFENIKLPYKAINGPASNGYVAFKIKPKPSVVVDDSLNNTAAIYFDFNMPVITNRATTIVTNASTPVPVRVEYFSISSRNNINTLNWKAACSNGSAKFSIERSDDGIHFSSIGTITATAVRCQLPFNFPDNDPWAGKNYYRLNVTDADGVSFYSKTLVAGNNKAGLQITGIANNIVYLSSNKQQVIQMKVVAADGKVLYQQSKKITAGNSNINLQIKNVARQICTLVLYTNDGEVITRRFIK